MQVKSSHFLIGWIALAALGGGGFIAKPLSERARLGREIISLQAELAKPADDPEALERLTADLQTLRELGKGRLTPIPVESDIAGLMTAISGTLDELGFQQRDITTRPVKSHGDAQSLPVTVALDGPFIRIYEAVSRIESLPRLVRIERLRVSTDPARRTEVHADGSVHGEFSIEAFFTQETKEAAAPGKDQP